ncbi:MAG: MmgE/PrpD family protein [Boseongicola sp.]
MKGIAMEDGVKLSSDDIHVDPVAFTLRTATSGIPEATRRRAAFLFLDTIGVCIAATKIEAGQIARETAVRFYSTSTPDDAATLLFDGRKASIPGAAFGAASQIDNLDAHDGFNPVKGHIGVALVPSLAAIAENIPNLRGDDALAALVIGYEVAGRSGLALHATVSDYHTSGSWNALGAAAMAARLRGVPDTTLRHALGIAEYHGPRSQMMREIANPTMLHDGSGMGAFVGLSSLLMAEMGFIGAPAITVEADEASEYWADLGDVWQTDVQYIKPYPICRWAHAPIDAARELCQSHGVTAEDVIGIRIASFQNAVQLFPGMPDTTSEAQYSLPYAVAKMIINGRIGVEDITGDALSDPVTARLVAATEMVTSAEHEANFPAGRSADVTLTLKSGEVLASGFVEARGGPDRPYSEADIVEKYMDYAVPVIGNERATSIFQATLALCDENGCFADLAALMSAPAEQK